MHQKSKTTVLSLANSIELATGIVHEITGSEVAKTIGGNRATRSVLSNLIGAKLNATYSQFIAKATTK